LALFWKFMSIDFRNVVLPPLHGFTASAPAGAIIGVIGEKGAGVPELLKLAGGMTVPHSGEVRGGPERRFVGLGDALNLAPADVIAMDQALATQDAVVRARTLAGLDRLRRAGSTILLASHEYSLLEQLCDEVWWLHDGRLAAKGDPREVLDLYGAEPGKTNFASACLLARRMVERGVRFVQIFHEAWDHHGGLTGGLKDQCGKTDKPAAALVTDLKRRGLLDETLVIWGGEFGRTPMVQGGDDGRDHHPNCFTMWMAGGGLKPGLTLGESDEFGFNATVDKVHVHDLHATLLHQLGFDHTKLVYRFQGRDFRLTDVHGELVTKMLA